MHSRLAITPDPQGRYNSHINLVANAFLPLQVLRYSALFAGIGYGLYHQTTINKKIQEHHNEEAIHHRESLVEKGKAEWVKKTSPPSDNGGMIPILLFCSGVLWKVPYN